MQNEGNVEDECNGGSPFNKTVMQRVIIKLG